MMPYHGNDNAPPTLGGYIFGTLMGLVFTYMSASLITALFSQRALSRLKWGKGGSGIPMSRISVLLCLPFSLSVPTACVVALVRPDIMDGPVPPWLYIAIFAPLLLGWGYDTLRSGLSSKPPRP